MDSLTQKKKAIHLPAVLALTATTTVVAVVTTLVLGSGGAGASEVDLTTETPSGDVLNAAAVLVDAEAALAEFATAENIDLAPEPAQSLCFFVRDDEGYVSDNLACGPARFLNNPAGTYLSLPLKFNVQADGVLGAIDPTGTFERADFTGSTLFRPDGVQPFPTDVFTALSLNEWNIPREYWDDATDTPDSTQVEVVDREPLPGFDGPITSDEVEFSDGIKTTTVKDAYIVRTIRTPDGIEYTNSASESYDLDFRDGLDLSTESSSGEWVMVEMETGYPHINHRDLEPAVFYMTGTSVHAGPHRQHYITDDSDNERTSRMIFVPRDENGELALVGITLTTDQQHWSLNTCHNPEFGGWANAGGDEGARSQIALNDTPEARAAFYNIGGWHFFEEDWDYDA